MGFSINQAIIGGNLVRDPDLKYTKSGKAVCTFTIVTETSRKNGDTWEKIPSYHKIIVWGGLGEYIGNNATKGQTITVTGRIQYRDYEKDGEKKYITEIVATDVVYRAGGGKTETQDYKSSQEVDPEDIPF